MRTARHETQSLLTAKWLTAKSVAEILGVSEFTVRKLMREGRIKTYKFGGSYRVTERDLLRFIEDSQISGKLEFGPLN